MKAKKCKQCGKLFEPIRPLQHVCGFDCAVDYGVALKIKNNALEKAKDRKETKAKLEKLKTRSDYLKEAQRVFNIYIRGRDFNEPCISCGRHHTGQYHAGHYRTTAAAPQLRFDEQNVHKQCAPCNNHKSGDIINYRINLIKKIGIEAVERLESDNSPKHYTIDEIKQIKIDYKNKIKLLKGV